jgi:hypothetical protein
MGNNESCFRQPVAHQALSARRNQIYYVGYVACDSISLIFLVECFDYIEF